MTSGSPSGQRPISDWSSAFLLADDATACGSAATPTSAGLRRAAFTAAISGVSPAPPSCVYRASRRRQRADPDGHRLPFPRTSENLQFRRVDTLVESLHIGMQVSWQSATQVSLNMSTVQHLLWGGSPLSLQVRMTIYDTGFSE